MARTKNFKRRYVTLIEMMIVMFLIALITGVIAYNYRGSLDEGKAFKTKAAIEKLETILTLKMAEDSDAISNIEHDWKTIVQQSPLVQNPSSLIKDGWGNDFTVTAENNVIHVHSSKYDDYKRTHNTMFGDNR